MENTSNANLDAARFMSDRLFSLPVRLLLLAVLCLIGVAIGAGGMLLFAPPAPFEENQLVAETSTSAKTGPLVAANPRLTPAEVVRLQVDALQAYRDDDAALGQCFALASPANRAVTGPIEKFARMVGGPGYRALILGEQTLVGRAVIRGHQATVLVTVVEPGDKTSIYRFFLTRQSEAPYDDCWMTDAVMADGIPDATEPEKPTDDVAWIRLVPIAEAGPIG
jgi:hypothetical protein